MDVRFYYLEDYKLDELDQVTVPMAHPHEDLLDPSRMYQYLVFLKLFRTNGLVKQAGILTSVKTIPSLHELRKKNEKQSWLTKIIKKLGSK